MNKNAQTPLDRVLQEMARLQLNNQQMAARLGISKAVWNHWKNRGLPESEYPTIASRLNWSIDYLVRGKDTATVAHTPLDVDALCRVIEYVEEWLQEHDLAPPADKRAPVIAAFYDSAMRAGRVDKQTIATLLKLMVANF